MAKKHKSARKKAKKGARKALKSVRQHKPLTAAVLAIGGVASSVLASQKFRDGVEDLIGVVMTRASKALDRVSSKTSDAVARVRDAAQPDGDAVTA